MQVIYSDNPKFKELLAPLQNRHAFSRDVDEAVIAIIEQVRKDGDAALVEFARKFDKAELTPDRFRVTDAEIEEASAQVSEETKTAIRTAVANVSTFSAKRVPQDWSFSPRPGVTLGEKFSPLERVGCYIPGGTAPLISTVVHTVTIAHVAGVKGIVVATPPGPGGKVNPAILFACREAGATEVYRLGGVYGVAAMAYGTETIRPVEKIMGPGNAYVAAAKRQVYGQVALDLVAGPSEIMVICDKTANPAFIAADLLSQAEHGSGREQAVMVTTERSLIQGVQDELAKQSAKLNRLECVQKVLSNGVFLVEVATLEEAAQLCNEYAPEHLELQVAEPEKLAAKINAAGAIFMGSWTPEPVGDFVAGPSHVLPTGGSGRFFNGLTVEQFFRRSSLVKYEEDALRKDLPHITSFANNEGLDAHGHSATIRFE